VAASSKKYHFASLCAIIALGMTGCGSSQSMDVSTTNTPASSPSESATLAYDPADLREIYPADLSITELRSLGEQVVMDDLVEAWEEATDEVCTADLFYSDTHEAERLRCDDHTILSVYSSATSVKRHLEDSDETFREHDIAQGQLAGQNWTAKVDEKLIPGLYNELGGVRVQLGY